MKRYLNIFFIAFTLITATCVSNQVQAASKYLVASGDWDASNVSIWSDTDGGAAGAVAPTAADDVFGTVTSGALAITISVSAPAFLAARCKSITLTGFTGSISGSGILTVSGSVTLGAGMTIAFTGNLIINATSTITSVGKSFGLLTIDGVGITVTLADALVCTSRISLGNGTFNANNFNVTAIFFTSNNSNTRVITMGSGTWTLTDASTVWDVPTTTGLTLNANTSTIKLTYSSTSALSFKGGGLTYNNLWIAGGASTGVKEIIGSNTFADLKDDGSAAHSILFTAGTTTTVTTFTVSGTAGNLITINSGDGAGAASTSTHTLSDASGTNQSQYLSVQHSVAGGGATWDAGTTSTDNQAVATAGSGWTFSNAPATTTTNPMLMGVGK